MELFLAEAQRSQSTHRLLFDTFSAFSAPLRGIEFIPLSIREWYESTNRLVETHHMGQQTLLIERQNIFGFQEKTHTVIN